MRSNIPDSAIPLIVQMISEGRDAREIAAICEDEGVTRDSVYNLAKKYRVFCEIQRVGRRVLELRRRHAKSTRSDFNGRAT